MTWGIKLLLAFCVVVVVASVPAMAILGVNGIKHTVADGERIYTTALVPVGQLADMIETFQLIRVHVAELVDSSDDGALDAAQRTIGDLQKTLELDSVAYGGALSNEGTVQKMFQDYRVAYRQYASVAERVMALRLTGRQADAIELQRTEGKVQADLVRDHMRSLLDQKLQSTSTRGLEINQNAQLLTWSLIGVTVLGLGFTVLFGVLIVRFANKPLVLVRGLRLEGNPDKSLPLFYEVSAKDTLVQLPTNSAAISYTKKSDSRKMVFQPPAEDDGFNVF